MKSTVLLLAIAAGLWPAPACEAQIKQTKEQILFYTSDWKGERFPDGRPKVPESLLTRALDVSIEDIWDYLRGQGYVNQFEAGWQALHVEKPFAGRALTAQFMPARPDITAAVAAEGKAEGRVSGTNSWVINELQMGDTMVCDGYGKVIEGTLIGSNLGSGIAHHTHSGFIFDAGIRDAEENREIANLNGFYRGYDPSAWAQMQLTGINVPVRIGRAVVLPGDLVLEARRRDLHSRGAGVGGHRQGRVHQPAGRVQFRAEQVGRQRRGVRRRMDGAEVCRVREVDRSAPREAEDDARGIRRSGEAGAGAARRTKGAIAQAVLYNRSLTVAAPMRLRSEPRPSGSGCRLR